MSNQYYTPRPVFDTIGEVLAQYKSIYESNDPKELIRQWLKYCFASSQIDLPNYAVKDYQLSLGFLYSYRGSNDTFTAYRRDVERLLQWSWFIREKSVLEIKRDDLESFIEFCMKPNKRWIGLKKVARFKKSNGERVPNPAWRPFEACISKKDRKDGKEPVKEDYQFSQQALKAMFGILSSFYNYLIQEEMTEINPVLLIRQKSKFIRKDASIPTIRRLSSNQWRLVIALAKAKAQRDIKYERTVFVLTCLYGMYLRISELVASSRWVPTMGDFFKDSEDNWWFKTVGKGNKLRQIAVSEEMLEALKHYRKNYLKLPPYPTIDEKIPLITHIKNSNKAITSERILSKVVQKCFDEAANELDLRGEQQEADLLRTATVHWLRHTGISEDVKIRPREHVRDDAGHSSSAITDRYIDVEMRARARSARNKKIIPREVIVKTE